MDKAAFKSSEMAASDVCGSLQTVVCFEILAPFPLLLGFYHNSHLILESMVWTYWFSFSCDLQELDQQNLLQVKNKKIQKHNETDIMCFLYRLSLISNCVCMLTLLLLCNLAKNNWKLFSHNEKNCLQTCFSSVIWNRMNLNDLKRSPQNFKDFKLF